MYLNRLKESNITESLQYFPVTAIIGPRQCGKSTLVKEVLSKYSDSIYLDLEKPSDLVKLENAEWFFSSQRNKLICIDEIQRKPELFPLIRSLVDEWGRAGAFLILGSASRDLLKQSSESLAGRIVYKRLSPFLISELSANFNMERYIAQGAFPRSYLVDNVKVSYDWRVSFIETFLERDLLQWAGFTPITMRRLWTMIAHLNGQMLNNSSLASSLGVSSTTVKNYIDLLEGTYMLEVIPPYLSNLGKRLTKSPKVYVADSGITAALLGLRRFEDMIAHPSFGSIWEQIVLSNLKGTFPEAEFFYYRTTNGAECDFVMKHENKIFAIECKASYEPSLSKGNYNAIEDINPTYSFVVSPNPAGWAIKQNIDLVSISELISKIQSML